MCTSCVIELNSKLLVADAAHEERGAQHQQQVREHGAQHGELHDAVEPRLFKVKGNLYIYT